MSGTYTAYTNLNTPNEVIEKMRDFVVSKGYYLVQDLIDDKDIYDHTEIDGKKFTFLDKSSMYYINMRSQNGFNIFGLNSEYDQDSVSKSANTDGRLSGVGMVVSESWDDSPRWYNQVNVPVKYNTNPDVSVDVLGAYMPVPEGKFIEKVIKPDEVQEPAVVLEPDPPVYPTSPIQPIAPVERSVEKPKKPEKSKVHFIGDKMNLTQLYTEYKGNSPEDDFGANTWRSGMAGRSYVSGFTNNVHNVVLNITSRTIPDVVDSSILYPTDYQQYVVNFNGTDYVPVAAALMDSSSILRLTQTGAGASDAYYNDSFPTSSGGHVSYLSWNSTPYANRVKWPSASDVVKQSDLPYTFNDPPTKNPTTLTSLSNVGNDLEWFCVKDSFYAGAAGNASGTNTFTRNHYSHGNMLQKHVTGSYYWWYDGMYAWIKKDIIEQAINYQQALDDWTNERGTAWDTYRAQKAQANADYQQAMQQYNIDYANYLSAKQAYDSNVASITATYNAARAIYDNYLLEKARYDAYLVALQRYLDYLAELASTRYYYTLFCNEVLIPEYPNRSTITFSLMKSNDDYYQVSHLIVGNLIKYDDWTGGIIFSGSANRYNMIPANDLYSHKKTSDSTIYPVLSSGKVTNTYLRIDVGKIPAIELKNRPKWASSGEDNITNRLMTLPIRTGNGATSYGNGLVPHFRYMQSHDRLDSGRDMNTLNCVTVNLPLRVAVRVEPYNLDNYAAAGEVMGVYFVSMYNIQTSSVYEVNYPSSNNTCQAFSVGKRRGVYGFDGISVKQMDDF